MVVRLVVEKVASWVSSRGDWLAEKMAEKMVGMKVVSKVA